MSNNNEPVEKLDIESLIVDLLACGLGASIILFFIFSIQVIGKSAQGSITSANSNVGSTNEAFSSLIGDDSLNTKGRMGAVRIVEFYDVEENDIIALKNSFLEGSSFWDTSGFKSEKIKSVREIVVCQNYIAFVLRADGIRKVTFKIPDGMVFSAIKNPVARMRIIFVEGKTRNTSGFDGTMYYPEKNNKGVEINRFNGLNVNLKMGKAKPEQIDRLIEIKYSN